MFKMLLTKYWFANHIYSIYMYKKDLALNNLERLLCHNTQLTNQQRVDASE